MIRELQVDAKDIESFVNADRALSDDCGRLATAGDRPPRLTIVIATWNAAGTLLQCIQSIVGQTYDDWELLIADGGSTDGTVEFIRQYESSLAWWTSETDGGIYDAWNKALSHARGEYIAFLGADDSWHRPTTLSSVFASIGSSKYDIVTGRGVLIDAKGRAYHEFGNQWDYLRLMKRMTICHPGALHRRELFDQFGKFDTSYRISADYDFLLRLPRDIRTLHVDLPITNIADGGVSRSSKWTMLRERYRAQAACPRIGAVRAAINLADKLWRIPVAIFADG